MTQLVVAGGKGLEMFPGAEAIPTDQQETPYGKPSGEISRVQWNGAEFFCFSRHGDQQQLPPHKIPYLANAYALKSLGVEYWVSVSLVTSLKGKPKEGCLVVADDYTSLGIARDDQFFQSDSVPGGMVLYTDNLDDNVSPILKKLISDAAQAAGQDICLNREGDRKRISDQDLIVYAGYNGPETGTRAEQKILTLAFENVISGMTNFTEALICKQAGIDFLGLSYVGGRDLNYGGIGNSIGRYLKGVDERIVPVLKEFVGSEFPKQPERTVEDFLSQCTCPPDLKAEIRTRFGGTAIDAEIPRDSRYAELLQIVKTLIG